LEATEEQNQALIDEAVNDISDKIDEQNELIKGYNEELKELKGQNDELNKQTEQINEKIIDKLDKQQEVIEQLQEEKNMMNIEGKLNNVNICCEPIQINKHVLVPFELIEKIFGKKNSETNDINQKIDLKVILEQQNIEDKDILNVLIKINNLSNVEETLEFRTSQKYNILIKDKNNDSLYNWENGKMFTQAFTYNTIETKSSIEFIEKIDISHLETGTYSLVLILKSNNYDNKNKEVEFSINK
jgi:hypothetical protein